MRSHTFHDRANINVEVVVASFSTGERRKRMRGDKCVYSSYPKEEPLTVPKACTRIRIDYQIHLRTCSQNQPLPSLPNRHLCPGPATRWQYAPGLYKCDDSCPHQCWNTHERLRLLSNGWRTFDLTDARSEHSRRKRHSSRHRRGDAQDEEGCASDDGDETTCGTVRGDSESGEGCGKDLAPRDEGGGSLEGIEFSRDGGANYKRPEGRRRCHYGLIHYSSKAFHAGDGYDTSQLGSASMVKG